MNKEIKVSFTKNDYNRFAIQLRYLKQLVDICKSIPGRKFNIHIILFWHTVNFFFTVKFF